MMMAIVPDTSLSRKQFTDELEDLPYMKSVTSLSGQPRKAYRKISFRTASQASYIKRLCENPIYVKSKGESKLAYQCSDEIQAIAKKYYLGKFASGRHNTVHTGHPDDDHEGLQPMSM